MPTFIQSHPDRESLEAAGADMLALVEGLWPINRSLAGPGIRQTLDVLGQAVGGLEVFGAPTGSRVLDWIVPDEWHPRAAFIEAPDGRRFCDLTVNNLHLVGYSTAVDARLPLEDLQPHL